MLNVANLSYLKILTQNKNNSQLVRNLVKSAKINDLLIIFELTKNILECNVPISEKQKQKLRKYEKKLVFLSEKRKKFKDKVNILLKSKNLLELLLKIGKEFLIDPNYSTIVSDSESDNSDFEDD
jgi:hypothetical protein